MIVQADAWVAKCVTCGATGALGRDAVDARTIAVKDGWRAERRPGEHKSTMTCPTCIPADLRPPPAEAEATVQAWEEEARAKSEVDRMIAAWLVYFEAQDRQNKSGKAADAPAVFAAKRAANGIGQAIADALYQVALARHRSRHDIPADVRAPNHGVDGAAVAVPPSLTHEQALALLVRGMGHSEDVAAGLLRNARTILAKGHAGDPDMPITAESAPVLHAVLRGYLASLRAAPPSEGSRGVDRQAAASAHPECSTCGAMAAKGFDVWCPHMAATSP